MPEHTMLFPAPSRSPWRKYAPTPKAEPDYYSPEVDELSDFLAIPVSAARRALAVMGVS